MTRLLIKYTFYDSTKFKLIRREIRSKKSNTAVAIWRKNPPSRGAGCVLKQVSKRLIPTSASEHRTFRKPIHHFFHQKSQTTQSYKFLSVLAPRSVGKDLKIATKTFDFCVEVTPANMKQKSNCEFKWP